MADKPLEIVSKALQSSVEGLFQPSHEQKQAKSAFWHAVSQGEVPQDQLEPDLASASRFGGTSKIRTWWDLAGFIDWFYNKEDFRRRATYVGELALEELEKILTSSFSKEKLPAIKLGLEVAGKLQKVEAEVSDSQIAKMTRKELEEYISKRAGLIAPPKPE